MSTNVPFYEELDRLRKANGDLLVALIAIVDLIPEIDSKESSEEWWRDNSFIQAKANARAAIARANLTPSQFVGSS